MVRRRFVSPEGQFVSARREPVTASAVASCKVCAQGLPLSWLSSCFFWFGFLFTKEPSGKGKGCSRRKIKAVSSFFVRWEDRGALAEFLDWLLSPRRRLWWGLAARREAGSMMDSQQADEAAEALSRGQRHLRVLWSGVWVLGRSGSEVVHREDTTRDSREALLWDVVLIRSYSCSTNTERFYFKKRFKKFSKENTVCSFLCLKFTNTETTLFPWALQVQSCLFLLAFEVQSCLSLHLLLVLSIQLTPRERKACPSTCSSSFPRRTCLINVQLICFDATPVSSFSSQKKRELSPWSWPFTLLSSFLNLKVSVFEMQREESQD